MTPRSYGRQFLEENGFFERDSVDAVRFDGESAACVVDPAARLAYVEGVDPDRQPDVVSELRSRGRNVDYCWFWNPSSDRVAVYSRYGEHRWFVYDQSVGHTAEVRDGKRARLASVDEGLGSLFDVRDAVDRFYRNLWDVRLDIARSFETPGGARVSDEARLLTAQRTIDRLVFCYFLVETNVVHGRDSAGNRHPLDPTETFRTVIDEGDFHDFLAEACFDHLTATGWTEYEVTDTLAVAFPYLNAGLFRNHRVPTESGGEIRERELDGGGCDWGVLVDEFDEYSWLLEQSPESADGASNELSPAVLGHVFEKFVITVSELSGEESLSLAELDRMDVSASGEQLLEGNRRVGAYYTPNYIAYENTRETLWNAVREKLARRVDVAPAAIPDAGEFFERVRGDGAVPVDLGEVDDVLSSLSVLDPSAGSGAFLLTAGEMLAEWRQQCDEDASRYDLRREVVSESLYGVDLLDGAVEVCKLRLWLWLVSADSVDLTGGAPDVETLPNVDGNVRQGNSLVGLTAADEGSLHSSRTFEWTDGEMTTYPDAVEEYHETSREYRPASGARAETLRERLTDQRRILREELDRIYAEERDVTVEEDVPSREAFREVMATVEGRVKLNLDFDSAMTDEERRRVSDAGFREQRNWKTTAYHRDVRESDSESVEAVFELMDGRGTVSVERPIGEDDVAELDPFHWPLEFPTACSSGDDDTAFDVVLGNPPHGSELGDLQKAVLEDAYDLVEGGREVTKLFTERGWELTGGELSYVVPKASTYNSNWEDFREFCLEKLHRGVDLGKAFGNVDHEQVTIHLSKGRPAGEYRCGRLTAGAYHLDDVATVDRAFASRLGTLPVSFSAEQQEVAAGLGDVDYPTLGDVGVDAGRGASTRARTGDASAPIAYNGKQVQRYFTRAAVDHVDASKLSSATRRRVETPKVMAQNIVAHRKNPYDHVVVAAAYDPVGVYDFETVTNVVLPDESGLTYPALAVLLNTQFANWFVYYSIFNRAIRDMHLDSYFLDHLVVPKSLSDAEATVLDRLYGLLAVANTAVEYDGLLELDEGGALPDPEETYEELQSVANALTYELYLRDASTRPLETDLSGLLSGLLGRYDVAYRDWYASHLENESEAQVVERFSEELFRNAVEVAEAVRTEAVDVELAAVADHPWVTTIERGRHVADDESRPTFGPTQRN